jgi:hypothetical protein
MKIAFCFCGEIRTGVYALPNILNFIGDLLPNTDFFIHTWNKNSFKVLNPNSLMSINGCTQVEHKLENTIYDLEKCCRNKLVSSEVENIDLWYKGFNNQYTSFSPQWYSWYKVNNLKKQYENINNFKYDIVVKTRLDFIVPAISSLRKEIINITDDTFFAQGVTPTRINDVFFMSTSIAMDEASEFILNPPSKVWYTNIFADYLSEKNIPVKSTIINTYAIYRPESIPLNPVLFFNKCFNDDNDWYSDKSFTHRLQ